MSSKSKPEEVKKGAPEYMNTYGDLVTLLLCFFVLLFAASTVDAQKFNDMAGSFQNRPIMGEGGGKDTLKALYGSGIMQMPAVKTTKSVTEVTKSKSEAQVQAEEELQKMASDFKSYFAENNISEQVQVEVKDNGVMITFSDNILFDVGKATLRKESLNSLNLLATELAKYPNSQIQIEGHTDNDPIKTPQFPSNWYLSSARSIAVLTFLVDEKGFSPQTVSALGKGEYVPIAPNDTPENKSKNRRVEVLVKSQFAQ